MAECWLKVFEMLSRLNFWKGKKLAKLIIGAVTMNKRSIMRLRAR